MSRRLAPCLVGVCVLFHTAADAQEQKAPTTDVNKLADCRMLYDKSKRHEVMTIEEITRYTTCPVTPYICSDRFGALCEAWVPWLIPRNDGVPIEYGRPEGV